MKQLSDPVRGSSRAWRNGMSPSLDWMNRTVWTGDQLDIMCGMNSESTALIYLDPPFNSKADYAAPTGSKAAAWYWRFVDVVWLFLFTFVYWWASWNAAALQG